MIDVVNKRVLVFGDSLTHRNPDSAPNAVEVTQPSSRVSASPGDLLASHLLEAGAAAARIDGRIGRSSVNLWTREHGKKIVAADLAWKPDVVIIMLGTNDLGGAKRAASFAKLGKAMGASGAEVWAVGPPIFASSKRRTQAAAIVATMANVFGDHFVDWRPMTTTTNRTGDGVHFKPAGAKPAAAKLAYALLHGQTVAALTPAAATGPAQDAGISRWLWALGAGLAAFGIVELVYSRHHRSGRLAGVPDDWWRHHKIQPEMSCYATKTAALQAFRDYNRAQIEEWGGLDRKDSAEEYDAINHKHALKGKRAVRTLSRAIWEAMPGKAPFCLDKIDIELLNETSPGQSGNGFRLPEWVGAEGINEKEEAYYLKRREAEAEAEIPFVVPPGLQELFAKGMLVRRGTNIVWSKGPRAGQILAHVTEVALLPAGRGGGAVPF